MPRTWNIVEAEDNVRFRQVSVTQKFHSVESRQALYTLFILFIYLFICSQNIT